jgi:hypothetical protein
MTILTSHMPEQTDRNANCCLGFVNALSIGVECGAMEFNTAQGHRRDLYVGFAFGVSRWTPVAVR